MNQLKRKYYLPTLLKPEKLIWIVLYVASIMLMLCGKSSAQTTPQQSTKPTGSYSTVYGVSDITEADIIDLLNIGLINQHLEVAYEKVLKYSSLQQKENDAIRQDMQVLQSQLSTAKLDLSKAVNDAKKSGFKSGFSVGSAVTSAVAIIITISLL